MCPSQFEPLPTRKADHLPDGQDYFRFKPELLPDGFADYIFRLCEKAHQIAGRIDLLVFPEMAFTPRQFQEIVGRVAEDIRFVVGGVYDGNTDDGLPKNYARICISIQESKHVTVSELRQYKHHRWFLDRSQIETYGLGGVLDPSVKWWEAIGVPQRRIHLIEIDPQLVFSVLICEDLARPDPLGEIIRAVGPNLLIALLQDGPQLASRWAGRYVIPLSDDPGCSVLTVTSAGMASLSRPLGHSPAALRANNRIVGLWRDKESGSRELYLPEGADALVLCLNKRMEEEWSSDGRSDGGHTSTIALGGVHPIAVS